MALSKKKVKLTLTDVGDTVRSTYLYHTSASTSNFLEEIPVHLLKEGYYATVPVNAEKLILVGESVCQEFSVANSSTDCILLVSASYDYTSDISLPSTQNRYAYGWTLNSGSNINITASYKVWYKKQYWNTNKNIPEIGDALLSTYTNTYLTPGMYDFDYDNVKYSYSVGQFGLIGGTSPYPTVTPSSTPSITPTLTVTPTATVTPTISITPTISKSTSPSVSATPSISVTPSISLSISATPSVTATPSETPSISVTPTVTPTASPSETPSITVSTSVTPSETPSITVTPSNTVSNSVTPSNTVSTSVTPSITITPTVTPTVTVSPSETPSVTTSTSVTPSITVTRSITPTVTPTVSTSFVPSPTTTPSITTTPNQNATVRASLKRSGDVNGTVINWSDFSYSNEEVKCLHDASTIVYQQSLISYDPAVGLVPGVSFYFQGSPWTGTGRYVINDSNALSTTETYDVPMIVDTFNGAVTKVTTFSSLRNCNGSVPVSVTPTPSPTTT